MRWLLLPAALSLPILFFLWLHLPDLLGQWYPRDRFCGRQLVHGWGRGRGRVVSGWFKCVTLFLLLIHWSHLRSPDIRSWRSGTSVLGNWRNHPAHPLPQGSGEAPTPSWESKPDFSLRSWSQRQCQPQGMGSEEGNGKCLPEVALYPLFSWRVPYSEHLSP